MRIERPILKVDLYSEMGTKFASHIFVMHSFHEIFFDEIQAFPEIATSLKFFYEEGRFIEQAAGKKVQAIK